LLVSITAQLGAVGLVPAEIEESYVNQHTALIRPRLGQINPRWAAFCMLSPIGKRQFELRTNGGTKQGLTLDDVRDILIPYPPLNEQASIVVNIDSACKETDNAMRRTSVEIDLIREYRTRLIADVVAGKVDVRGLAADLPEISSDEMQTVEEADDLVEDEEIDESADAGEDDFAAD
jgi:type I restriction enzyme S subunit